MTKSEDGSKELYTKIFNIFHFSGVFPYRKDLFFYLNFS